MFKEIAKGMAFTLKQMLSKPITLQWPEEQKPSPPRHRGRHILHRYDNVGSAENDPAHPVSPGERYAERYEINLMRCIYCGYCAEACPTEAITLGPRYELADYRRERLVATKEDLLEAWPGFEKSLADNPRGAGADQREQAGRAPGVSPRVAWEDREGAVGQAGRGSPAAGQEGLAPHVPTVATPPKRNPG